MLNYTKMSLGEGVARGDVHDVIANLASDLMGWSITLHAMTEQGSVIEDCQIEPVSTALYYASEALTEVQKAVDAIIYGGNEDD